MKNIFRKSTAVKPSRIGQGQRLPKDFSAKVRKLGIGYGIKYILKQTVGGARTFEVADTNSMVPHIDTGHLAHCIPAVWDDLQVGDVCVYRAHDGTLIYHRITKIEHARGRATFKGDNNLFSDLPVMKDQVEYVEVAVSVR